MAKNFYDISKPEYRALHRAYIRQCLDNFVGSTGVIQMISAEFTGPLHFVQFWIDVIKEWETEKGINALVALSTTKDVQDSILSDPGRSPVVDIIDIRYWSYNSDGKTASGPKGGINLSPRQQSRGATWAIETKRTRTDNERIEPAYQAVRDYRERFPEKAVLYSVGRAGWQVLMGGGSLASIPVPDDPGFLTAAATMRPADITTDNSGKWMLSSSGSGYIVYTNAQAALSIDLSKEKGSFRVKWFNPSTGQRMGTGEKVKGGRIVKLNVPGNGDAVVWLSK